MKSINLSILFDISSNYFNKGVIKSKSTKETLDIKDINGPLIYKVENIKNHKIYIGQTKFSLIHRFLCHQEHFRNKNYTSLLYDDIRKYGLKFFEVQVMRKLPNKTLDEQEIYYIKKFNSLTPNGYNRTIGGKSFSEEAREKVKGTGAKACEKLKVGAFYDQKLRDEILDNARKKSWEVKALHAKELLKELKLKETKENYEKIVKQYRTYDNEFLRWENYIKIIKTLK